METDEIGTREGHVTTITAIVGIAVVWIVFQIWQHFHNFKHFERLNVPYRQPVPFFGSMAPIALKKVPFSEFVQQLYNEFPNVKYSGIFEFSNPVYLLRDPDIIKTVMVREFHSFPQHKPFVVDESTDKIGGGNLFAITGQRWKDMRTILSPVFTSSKLRGMFDLLVKCGEYFMDYLLKEGGPVTLDVKEEFKRYTLDAIATSAFGVDLNTHEDRENEFFVMARNASGSAIPGVKLKTVLMIWFPRIMRFLKAKMVPEEVARFYQTLVKDIITVRRQQGIIRPDLINLLMEARHKSTNEGLTMDEITAQAFSFFVAGFDTTSTLMSFASHMLAIHPEIQERLIKEVDAAYERGNGVLTYDAVNETHYLEMILNETLRFYPPAVLTDREATREFVLPPANDSFDPVVVRPGDRVWIPIYALHHDPRYFPNPEKFDPERFSPENRAKVQSCTFLPFGAGPRNCPGNRLAIIEAKIVLCTIFRKFRVKPCDKTENPLTLNKGSPIISAANGFWLTFVPREQTK